MSRIEDYRFGHIVLDGSEHNRDVIIMPDRVVQNWWRKDGHGLVTEDLDEVMDDLPERLIIGTGAQGQMKPDPGALDELRGRGLKVEVMPTGEAVLRYGELDPATTAAALHLTC